MGLRLSRAQTEGKNGNGSESEGVTMMVKGCGHIDYKGDPKPRPRPHRHLHTKP